MTNWIKRSISVACIGVLVMALGACHHQKPVSATSTQAATDSANSAPTRIGSDANARSVNANGANGGMVGMATENTGPAVYFAYDSSEVSSEYNALLDATAKRLLANKTAKVRLEGNTDERGSAEYNIGLGERRAQAVKHALVVRGVSDNQLATVSYGAERPQAQGHDEQAWSKNRRVDLVDANR